MNRGFKTYFKEGFIASKQTLRKKGNYLRYYQHLLICLLGFWNILTLPLVLISSARISKMTREDGKLDVIRSFQSIDKPKTYFTSLLSIIMYFFYFITGLLLIAIVGGIPAFLGYRFSVLVSDSIISVVVLIVFSLPLTIGTIIYLIKFPLYFAPINYVIDSSNDVGSSDCLKICRTSMKKGGKRIVFFNILIACLINLMILALGPVAFILINQGSDTLFLVAILVDIIIFIIFVMVHPLTVLACKASNYSLFKDMIQESVLEEDKIIIKKIKKNYSNVQADFNVLFAQTEDVQSDEKLKEKPIDKENQPTRKFVSKVIDENEEIEEEKIQKTPKTKKSFKLGFIGLWIKIKSFFKNLFTKKTKKEEVAEENPYLFEDGLFTVENSEENNHNSSLNEQTKEEMIETQNGNEEQETIEEPISTSEEHVEEPVITQEPIIEEEPVVDEAPINDEQSIFEEETPVIEETPIVETPVAQETSLIEEAPITEENTIEEENSENNESELGAEEEIQEDSIIEEPIIEEEPIVEEPAPEEEPTIEEPALEEEPIVEEPAPEEEPTIEEPVVEEKEDFTYPNEMEPETPIEDEHEEFYVPEEKEEPIIEEEEIPEEPVLDVIEEEKEEEPAIEEDEEDTSKEQKFDFFNKNTFGLANDSSDDDDEEEPLIEVKKPVRKKTAASTKTTKKTTAKSKKE